MIDPACSAQPRGAAALVAPPGLLSRTERTRPVDASTPLQRISMEISRRCNLRCVYCYACSGPKVRTGLTDEQIRMVIKEAVDCGAALVSFVSGGEPLLRYSVVRTGQSCLEYANSLGCYCLLYTNCTMINVHKARWLHSLDVSVVGKLNSLRDEVQDGLAGVKGAAGRIRRGVENLLLAGFADSRPSRLALETIICRQNYDEMPEIWRWMRDRNIVPEVEIPTVHGRFEENQSWLYFGEDEARRKYEELFEELLRIDRTEYGYDWPVQPPFPAASCRLYYNNCYINDRGGVQPCAGIDQEYGHLRLGERGQYGRLRLDGGEVGAGAAAGGVGGADSDGARPLADIILGEEFQKLRQVHLYLKEPCAGCDLLDQCYGCRGAAWHATGDIFAGDPVCWRRP
jgi:MoaA/NifB/PqqE/SkfB family radical SAM enzyme